MTLKIVAFSQGHKTICSNKLDTLRLASTSRVVSSRVELGLLSMVLLCRTCSPTSRYSQRSCRRAFMTSNIRALTTSFLSLPVCPNTHTHHCWRLFRSRSNALRAKKNHRNEVHKLLLNTVWIAFCNCKQHASYATRWFNINFYTAHSFSAVAASPSPSHIFYAFIKKNFRHNAPEIK